VTGIQNESRRPFCVVFLYDSIVLTLHSNETPRYFLTSILQYWDARNHRIVCHWKRTLCRSKFASYSPAAFRCSNAVNITQ